MWSYLCKCLHLQKPQVFYPSHIIASVCLFIYTSVYYSSILICRHQIFLLPRIFIVLLQWQKLIFTNICNRVLESMWTCVLGCPVICTQPAPSLEWATHQTTLYTMSWSWLPKWVLQLSSHCQFCKHKSFLYKRKTSVFRSSKFNSPILSCADFLE